MRIDIFSYAFFKKNKCESNALTVTENGLYEADEGGAYNPVTVNVPQSISVESLSVSENGTYIPELGIAYSPVNVNVTEQIKTLQSVPQTKDTDIIIVSGIYYLWKEGVSA